MASGTANGLHDRSEEPLGKATACETLAPHTRQQESDECDDAPNRTGQEDGSDEEDLPELPPPCKDLKWVVQRDKALSVALKKEHPDWIPNPQVRQSTSLCDRTYPTAS